LDERDIHRSGSQPTRTTQQSRPTRDNITKNRSSPRRKGRPFNLRLERATRKRTLAHRTSTSSCLRNLSLLYKPSPTGDDMDIVIGITGLPCSGKTTLTNALMAHCLEHGIVSSSLSMSDLLRDFHKWLYNVKPKGSLLRLGQKYRGYWGQGWLAHLAALKAEHFFQNWPFIKDKIFVIEGLRGSHEYETMCEHFGGYFRFGGRFFLVYIKAPLEIRVERSKKRGRIDDATTKEEFLQRERNEFEQSTLIGETLADAVIVSGDEDANAAFILWRLGCLKRWR